MSNRLLTSEEVENEYKASGFLDEDESLDDASFIIVTSTNKLQDAKTAEIVLKEVGEALENTIYEAEIPLPIEDLVALYGFVETLKKGEM